MPLRPDAVAVGEALDPQQPVRIEAHTTIAEHRQLIEGITYHEPLRRERGIEPVQRWLPLFEVMEIYPTAAHAIRSPLNVGCAPVRVFDAGRIEDPRRQHPHDVMLGLYCFFCGWFVFFCVVFCWFWWLL